MGFRVTPIGNSGGPKCAGPPVIKARLPANNLLRLRRCLIQKRGTAFFSWGGGRLAGFINRGIRPKHVSQSVNIAAARELLPLWVTWLGLLSMPVVTFVLASAMAYGCARVMLFRSQDFSSSWTERARRTFPIRYAKTAVPWACFGFLCIFFRENHNPLLNIPTLGIAVLLFPATLLSITVADRAIAPLIGDPVYPWTRCLKHTATRAFLLSPGLLILGVTFGAMPDHLGMRAIITASFGFGAFAALSMFGTMRLLYRVGLVDAASPRLLAAVGQAGEAVGNTPSAVFEIDLPAANAFAVAFPQQLVFTRRALEILDHEKLVAVACHELAHLSEPPKVRWLRLAQNLTVFPLVFGGVVYERFGLHGIILLIAIYSLTRRRFTAMRRRMEDRADATAHEHEPYAGVYAAALEMIYRANNAPAVLRSRRAHGNLYDRMIEAGVRPAYERPAPPAYMPIYAAFIVCLVLLSGLEFGFSRWSRSLAVVKGSQFTEAASLWRLAIGAGGASTAAQIAASRELDGRPEEAAVLLRAASELDDNSVLYPARLATVLSSLGRCKEAFEALADAESNLECCSGRETGAAFAEVSAKLAVTRCASTHGDEKLSEQLRAAD